MRKARIAFKDVTSARCDTKRNIERNISGDHNSRVTLGRSDVLRRVGATGFALRWLTFRLKMFTRGPHTVEVGDPDLGKKKTLKGLTPAPAGETIVVEF